MLRVKRTMGSVVTSAIIAGLALIVISVFGAAHWVATMIATLVIAAVMLVRRYI